LQFTRSFGFQAAREIVPYLHSLGVSDVYASPLFAARSGSTHGYDVVDPTQLNPELGSREDFDALVTALKNSDMGLILDIVPNHMAASTENPWWLDVLRLGQRSEFARYFDVDWERGGGTLTLPILHESLDEALKRGRFSTEVDDGETWLGYHGHRLPLDTDKRPGEPVSMEGALSRQPYRLVHWREGAREVNYRRFFGLSDLVGVRVEDRSVFDATHVLIAELVHSGSVTGLRVDHIDGLFDPARYLTMLRQLAAGAPHEPYIIVEKILMGDEELPASWSVSGTTGYDFLNCVNGLFIDPGGVEHLCQQQAMSLAEIALREKRRMAGYLFDAETTALGDELVQLATSAGGRLVTADLRAALVEVSAHLAVYRTYIDRGGVTDRDRRYVEEAVGSAKKERRSLGTAIEFISRALLLDAGLIDVVGRDKVVHFTMSWQQYTGALTAKGVEDSALYQYTPLMSSNEVGIDSLGSVAVSPRVFHDRMRSRLEKRPATMNATSTHDTKRGEDTRARINVLSELSGDWLERLEGWPALNGSREQDEDGRFAPDDNEQSILYQTLLGAWPADQALVPPEFVDRVSDYLVKAAREANAHTDWYEPNNAYERGLIEFVERILTRQSSEFRSTFHDFWKPVSFVGSLNGLAQAVLKMTCPGVPDFYQGTELLDLSLVDPDNRRPVDFAARRESLSVVQQLAAEGAEQISRELPAGLTNGRLKLFVIQRLLNWRRDHRDLFSRGEYVPIASTTDHAVAFFRRLDDLWALIAVPRLTVALTAPGTVPLGAGAWGENTLELPSVVPSVWTNVLTGERLSADEPGPASMRLAATFRRLPVAVLTNESKEGGGD
jgi:(1->4)-alpha-D-glucan 1-alpha-D-glucosylmutase